MKRQRLGVLLHDLSQGGTERIALRLAGEWARCGREVTIFCGNPAGCFSKMVPANACLVHPDKPIARGWLSRQRLGAWVAAACRERKIDGLFLPGNFHFAALPALRAAMAPGMVIVCKLSNPVIRSDRSASEQLFSQWRMASRLRKSDAVVAMSPALAKEARRILGEVPLTTIAEPILSDEGSNSRDRPETRNSVVAAGRFAWQKDFALAVRTVGHLRQSETQLTILGNGPLFRDVNRLSLRLALDEQVQLPGRVDSVAPWFNRSRVFLLSSRYEGFPAVAVEALAAGVRIVATDCSPAIREIVTGPELGEVVNSRCPHVLAAAIDRQMQLGPVPAHVIDSLHRRYGLGRSAKRYLQLFDSL